ncbi:MAG: OmpA family protein, partial [Bacteroidota bacterium]
IEDTSYFPISQNLDLRDSVRAIDIKKDVQVISLTEMIDKGTSVPMNNLFFAFAKHDLLPSSIPELKRIATLIKRYNLKVEISGHTDDIGEDKNNQILSERRAKAVKEFFISSGCHENLLQTIGYGESRPIDTNVTEQGRAINRRVELRFIK